MYLLCLLSILLAPGSVQFDKILHDFGAVEALPGQLSCDYSFRNLGDSPVKISVARSTCSCTRLIWTTDPVMPGESGFVRATYTRLGDETYFSNLFFVYFEGVDSPFELSLKGSFYETPASLSIKYPIHLGSLGIKEQAVEFGHVYVGQRNLQYLELANLSDKPLSLSFAEPTDGLFIEPLSCELAPFEERSIQFSYTPGPFDWGLHKWDVSWSCDGEFSSSFIASAVVTDDFSSVSVAEMLASPKPAVDSYSYTVDPGASELLLPLGNSTDFPLIIRAVDSDSCSVSSRFPGEIPPHGKDNILLQADGSFFAAGSSSCNIYIVTNSPVSPLVSISLHKRN